eukprot:TRINITY_DN43402_c0_g1_i1.p1 TRINITY_DN43402_c0_g1~~TRINITY_DN43402_c0_g1_i1.p1  ORF type:complete len:837 (-),score=111.65 TRINITY_DN43402_c0_g1_i1:415-2775(-)
MVAFFGQAAFQRRYDVNESVRRREQHVAMSNSDTLWTLSQEGASCNDACEEVGLHCDQNRLAEIETEEDVKAAAAAAGHKCASNSGATSGWKYDINPGVCTSGECCGGDCQGMCTFGATGDQSCSATLQEYSRICPCKRKWLLGETGASCDAACGKVNAKCDAAALQEVDTADKIVHVAGSAGATCASQSGTTIGWRYDQNPAICTGDHCCLDGSCKGICTFGVSDGRSCSSASPEYSRLCPCLGGTSPTPAPPPPPGPQPDVQQISPPSFFWPSSVRAIDTSAGVSWYARVFKLLRESEEMEWQMGTAGQWLQPTNIDFDVCACDPQGWPSNTPGDPSFGCCNMESKCRWLYSTIEGGPGYWSGSELSTRSMKWRIVVTTGCYSGGAQTPLFQYAAKVVDCAGMGIVQLSNRMLLAPDGITFSREGLFGVGFVKTSIGKVSDDDDRNFWTFVVDTDKFAGPVAYFLPEVFRERPKNWEKQSAHLADFGTPGVGMTSGGGFTFEWNTLFTFQQGDFYKIPQMAVPSSGGDTILAMNGRGYEDADVYEPLEEVLSRRKPLRATDIMSHGTPYDCSTEQRNADFKASASQTATLGTLHTVKEADGCTWSVTTENTSGFFPRYFKASTSQLGHLTPVDESVVPSALQKSQFPKKNTMWPMKGPYDALSNPPAGGCLATPGPASPRMYCAQTSSLSWIGYQWYRFVDQPGMQQLALSDDEKHFLQSRVETLHESLNGEDRWIKAGSAASRLAEVSAAQLVNPPQGMEIGYVPIVVYEGMQQHQGCSEVIV